MTATQTMQSWIDAQQDLDAIEYGLRSIKTCGSAWATGPHAGQIARAESAAEKILGKSMSKYHPGYTWDLQQAKRKARLSRDEARAGKKALGGIRQLRLALRDEWADSLAAAA